MDGEDYGVSVGGPRVTPVTVSGCRDAQRVSLGKEPTIGVPPTYMCRDFETVSGLTRMRHAGPREPSV
jgi:hypothetical protein